MAISVTVPIHRNLRDRTGADLSVAARCGAATVARRGRSHALAPFIRLAITVLVDHLSVACLGSRTDRARAVSPIARRFVGAQPAGLGAGLTNTLAVEAGVGLAGAGLGGRAGAVASLLAIGRAVAIVVRSRGAIASLGVDVADTRAPASVLAGGFSGLADAYGGVAAVLSRTVHAGTAFVWTTIAVIVVAGVARVGCGLRVHAPDPLVVFAGGRVEPAAPLLVQRRGSA